MPEYFFEDRRCCFYGQQCQNRSGGYMVGEIGPMCAECHNRRVADDIVQPKPESPKIPLDRESPLAQQ